MTLAPLQLAFYRDNGYLLVPGVFSEERCDAVNAAVEKHARGQYQNYLNLHDRVPEVRGLLLDPALLNLCDQLQGHRMIPIGSIYFFCKPGNPLENGSSPHQDNYAVKSPYGSYLPVGVALDDADAENGALIVYPGSHALGDLPSVAKPNFEYDAQGKVTKAYPIGNTVGIPEGYAPKTLAYKKGSAIFLHSHLIHAAEKNRSRRWRRKIYLHYIKDGDPFWPGWNARRTLIDRP